jgi:T5SS/PEP-CTERM-associated repeat protein
MKRAILTASFLILFTSPIQAGDTYWDAGIGNWSTGANWDNGEPGPADHAYVNNGGTAQITTSNDELCDFLTIGEGDADSGTLNMTGGSLSVDEDLGVGYLGTGTLNVTGGAVSSHYGYVGYEPGSTGQVTVDGAGSAWTDMGALHVGAFGDGTLSITAGGAVDTDDSYIGSFAGSTGRATVDGAGSIWTYGTYSIDLVVGWHGAGTLDISGGATVSGQACHVGYEPGSMGEVTVDGSGSTLDNLLGVAVGREGDGSLSIVGGGVVIGADGVIGNLAGAAGEVTVCGDGSRWTNSSDVCVGYLGAASLNITDGGLVSVGGFLTIDYDEDGDGFIKMASGGMLAIYGDADDSLAKFLDLIDGTDAIRYWNNDISGWDDINNGTMGEDYWLTYMAAGDLAGYTVLTVPEPATIGLLAMGGLALLRRRNRK